MIFTNPVALYLLPLAVLQQLVSAQKHEAFPSLSCIEVDRL
jgi:mxaC protein